MGMSTLERDYRRKMIDKILRTAETYARHGIVANYSDPLSPRALRLIRRWRYSTPRVAPTT